MSDTFEQLELLAQQVHRAHRTAVGAELACRGLSEINPMLISSLKHLENRQEESFSQKDLAEMLHISPAAVTNSLKIMEKNGYICREPEENDARRNRVWLTDKGRGAVEECEAAFATVAERMLAGFTAAEQEQLALFRTRMLNNLRRNVPAREEEP